jgi:hypothetical protein
MFNSKNAGRVDVGPLRSLVRITRTRHVHRCPTTRTAGNPGNSLGFHLRCSPAIRCSARIQVVARKYGSGQRSAWASSPWPSSTLVSNPGD